MCTCIPNLDESLLIALLTVALLYFFFVFLPRLEDQNNGTPRTVLVSCLLLT